MEIQASVNGTLVRYDFTYYPAVTALPQFLLKGDTIDVEDLMTFVSFQIEFDMAKLSRLIYSTIGLDTRPTVDGCFITRVISSAGVRFVTGVRNAWKL